MYLVIKLKTIGSAISEQREYFFFRIKAGRLELPKDTMALGASTCREKG